MITDMKTTKPLCMCHTGGTRNPENTSHRAKNLRRCQRWPARLRVELQDPILLLSHLLRGRPMIAQICSQCSIMRNFRQAKHFGTANTAYISSMCASARLAIVQGRAAAQACQAALANTHVT
eukprot:1968001-Amphidinium_carterae.1